MGHLHLEKPRRQVHLKNSLSIVEMKYTLPGIKLFYLMQMPGMLDWFGWCTWDAFYQDVNPQGIRDGLKRFMLPFQSA